MSDEEPQQTEWETEVGLSEETTYVAIYPSRKHAEEWMEEAEEQGYGSRSKYLYELIQEARAARQEGFLAYSQNESKVEELQLQVEQLQDDLEDAVTLSREKSISNTKSSSPRSSPTATRNSNAFSRKSPEAVSSRVSSKTPSKSNCSTSRKRTRSSISRGMVGDSPTTTPTRR
ncbi:hypothetical protein U3A55_02505 [Salarchaeum sp. III]|uniref:hypothetical protein n=1 Tax=Salarchaeum sp. III TaxID=3107927 RepID=UPI002EDA9A90